MKTFNAPVCPSCNSVALAPILVSRKQAANALGVSLRGLAYLVAAKRLPSRRIGGRVLISVSALHEFAAHDRVDFILHDSA